MLNDQRAKNDCIVSGVDCKATSNMAESFADVKDNVGSKINSSEILTAYFLENKNNTKDINKTAQYSIFRPCLIYAS